MKNSEEHVVEFNKDCKIKIEVNGFKCLRCGHRWIPRVELEQLEKIYEVINNLEKDKFEIVKAKKLDIISAMDKKEREKDKTHVFKYVDIGNTEKDLGWILGFEEDILFNCLQGLK